MNIIEMKGAVGRALLTAAFTMLLVFAALLLLPPQAAEASATVTTYPGPTGIAASDQFSVEVNETESFVYQSDNPRADGVGGESASFTDFAFSGGSVTVEVTKLTPGAIDSVVIRPLDLGIVPTVSGSTVTFTLTEPAKVSVEINPDAVYQDVDHKLFIFADPPEVDVPDPEDDNVAYFGPGVHDIGWYTVPTGVDTIYIAGGAYVKGKLHNSDSGSLTIRGRGIFSGEDFPHTDGPGNFYFIGKNGVTMDGIISLDSNGFNIANNSSTALNSFTNLKLIGWRDNTDGIHTQGESIIDGLFFFGHDDAIDIGSFITDIRVTNSVIWNNWGAPMLFTWIASFGANAYVDNIDVIHDYGNTVFLLYHGGSGNLNNFTIQDVKVEVMGRNNSSFLHLELAKSQWSDPDDPYGSLSNVYFKDIELAKPTWEGLISGHGSGSKISRLLFDNVTVDGHVLLNLADAGITANSYTEDIRFIDRNYVDNWSFEADPGGSQTPSGWSTWAGNGGADAVADFTMDDSSYLGNHALRHYAAAGYQVNTMQGLSSLPNGTYKLTARVRSSGGQAQTIMEVKNYGGSTKAVDIPAATTWEEIEIDDIEVTNGQATIDFYSNAGAGEWIEADNVIFARKVPDNLVMNPGFEANGATQSPTGWWEAIDTNASYTESGNTDHTGAYSGVHHRSTAYEVYTGQSFTGLENGSYTLTAWVKSSGGQDGAFMEAKDYGGSSLKAAITASGAWTQMVIPSIPVTNGEAIIGFYSKAGANQTLRFDDVRFYKNN